MGKLRIGKLRQCFNSNGTPKAKYKTKQEAFEKGRETGNTLYPYKCGECGYWHNSSKRNPAKPRKRKPKGVW